MHAGGADVTAGRSPLIKGDRPGVDGRVNLIEGKCNRARAFLVSVLDAAGAGAGVRGVGAGGHCRPMVLRRTTCGDPGAAAAAATSDGPKLANVHHLLQDPARTDSGLPRVNFCQYKTLPFPKPSLCEEQVESIVSIHPHLQNHAKNALLFNNLLLFCNFLLVFNFVF